MICDASSARPIACAARAAAILPALDCGGSLAKNAATFVRRLRMRGQVGFLLLANPAAAWPIGCAFEEGRRAKSKDGCGVGAQRRPFERRSLVRVSGRGGERHEARGVALPVQDYGLGNCAGRRQGGSAAGADSSGLVAARRLRSRRLRGRRDRRGRPKRGRRAFKAGVGELDLGVLVAPDSLGWGAGARACSTPTVEGGLSPAAPRGAGRRLRDVARKDSRSAFARAAFRRRRRDAIATSTQPSSGAHASGARNGQKRAESQDFHGSSPRRGRMARSW